MLFKNITEELKSASRDMLLNLGFTNLVKLKGNCVSTL